MRWLDLLVVAWVALWVVMGVVVAGDVRQLADLSASITSTGRALEGIVGALTPLRGLPFVGGQLAPLQAHAQASAHSVAAGSQNVQHHRGNPMGRRLPKCCNKASWPPTNGKPRSSINAPTPPPSARPVDVIEALKSANWRTSPATTTPITTQSATQATTSKSSRRTGNVSAAPVAAHYPATRTPPSRPNTTQLGRSFSAGPMTSTRPGS